MMAAGATAYAWHLQSASAFPSGGDMRHHQDDQDGGTSLADLAVAWRRYGAQVLGRRSGWSAVAPALAAWRCVVVAGAGTAPGRSGVTATHAMCIIPTAARPDGKVLTSDPWYSGYQWLDLDDLRRWAARLDPDCPIGVSVGHAPAPVPIPPVPVPVPPDHDPLLGWAVSRWGISPWED